jgi:hypothetical protein
MSKDYLNISLFSQIIGRVTAFVAVALFIFTASASAATFIVATTADSGPGSLRAAIASANATIVPDTITFAIPASDPNCPAGVCTITLTSGELFVDSTFAAGTLTITNSTGASNLRISGNNTSRVFSVYPGGNLTINGVTITNGRSGVMFGGGIYNLGILMLTNSTVSGNTAPDNGFVSYGGGIFSDGTTTLTNSTVSGNTAGSGGGIFNNGGTTTLTNSTVSGNKAGSGSGINNNGSGIITLTNSTVSGNTGGSSIFSNAGATLNLTSVTVTNNSSISLNCDPCPGGILGSGGTINLNNTIVAGNTTASASASPDFGYGPVSSTSSYNIIGNVQSIFGISNGTNGNQVGTSASPINPRLAPLANNGGATQTHALLFGSPALDKGNSFTLTTDQRGFTRPVDFLSIPNAIGGDGSDIGAFEAQTAPLGTTAATVSVSGRVTARGRGISNAVVQLTSQSGEIQTARTNRLGYYTVTELAAGETYIFNVFSKRYQFNPQVVNLTEDLAELDFSAQ